MAVHHHLWSTMLFKSCSSNGSPGSSDLTHQMVPLSHPVQHSNHSTRVFRFDTQIGPLLQPRPAPEGGGKSRQSQALGHPIATLTSIERSSSSDEMARSLGVCLASRLAPFTRALALIVTRCNTCCPSPPMVPPAPQV